MNYKNNREPDFLPDFNLSYVTHVMHFYHLPKMYMGYFGKVPSEYEFSHIDIRQFEEKFQSQYEEAILGRHIRKNFSREDWEKEAIYVLKEGILLEIDREDVTLYFHDENSELLQKLTSFIQTFKKEKPDTSQINLITMQPQGLANKKIDFKKPDIDLSHIYNDDFSAFHERITGILQEEKMSGLHLLYGKPGTGKSTYIRYLCGQVEKEIVFLPGQMAQNLDNVAMTDYLMDHPNCVLVIEDAEELIVSRDQQRNSNLAMILNITDGILGEALGIQIIATFNTDVKNIDPALKRKGRLKSSYEFKALSAGKTNQLLKKEGVELGYSTELTLAEIYNISEEEQYVDPDRKAVGFR